MTNVEAVVLGVVQGLTEFLPISSTAHLRIVPAFVGWDDPGAAFTAVIQLGTMAAVLVYFRADILRIFVAWLRGLRDRRARATLDARMGWYIILGTIPIGIFGLVFNNQIETGARNLELIGSMLIAFALVMELADRMGRRERGIETLDRDDGIAIGARAGTGARAGRVPIGRHHLGRALPGARPARGSPILVPPVGPGGRAVRALRGSQDRRAGRGAAVPTAIATVLAFVVGYASIAFLLRYLTKHGLGIFVAYRIVLGVVCWRWPPPE